MLRDIYSERKELKEGLNIVTVQEAYEIINKYNPMHQKTFLRKIREGRIPAFVFKGKLRNTYRIPINLIKK